MAAYNEEKVVEEKINSIFQSNYPADFIKVWVGSDNSTDNTNNILERLSVQYPNLKTVFYKERNGKIKIINDLFSKANADVLIITDANVIFDKNTIQELVNSTSEEKVGLVDTRMLHSGIQSDGISKQENLYISNEVKVKNHEGILWGTMMGPFGGCYAVKKSLFKTVPVNFLVDDFFVNMHVLTQGYKAVSNLNAIVYEDVSNNLIHEFKRKIRIATGDFQNLFYFSFVFKKFFSSVNLCFFSHKVLRWFTPFFLLLAFISLGFLSLLGARLYLYFWLTGVLFLLLVFMERLAAVVHINIGVLRILTHFFYMNIALMIGFFKYLSGVRSSVWEPTPRLQAKNKN
jgi:cellulose synthase/poly-beta-1,6-N-acetylglucosamine synthase-like glycosyltransferase